MKPPPGWMTPARVNAALIVLGLISLGLYHKGWADEAALRIHAFTVTALCLAIPYALAAWLILSAPPARSTLITGLVLAAMFRLATMQTPAYLSTDLYRYVWDGRVQAAGINPYRYAPADPALAPLRDATIYPHINRKEYARTIYPPVAQIFYLTFTRFTQSVEGVRVVMLLCESVALWAIGRLLVGFAMPAQRILLYAWHPLAAWEFGSSAHIDAFMIALVALALLAYRRGWMGGLGALLAGATLTKLFPIVLLPALWKRWSWKLPAAFVSVALVTYAPYIWTFNLRGVLGFLPTYTSEEGLQSGDRFYLGAMIPGSNAFAHYTFVACAAMLMASVALWAFFAERRDELSFLRRSLALATLFLVILSPGYAWYFTWLIPFACLLPYPWLFWMTCAPFVLYLNWDLSELSDAFLQNSFIFLPAAVLWMFPALRRRFQPSMKRTLLCLLCVAFAGAADAQTAEAPHSLWDVYARYFQGAKYVDLTHTITPSIPVWSGFAPSKFGRTLNPKTGKPYTYKDDTFEASSYVLSTDQLGTQLDPPAHWNPDYPAIDELPPTFAIRPLVIISIVDQVKKDPGYQMTVDDVKAWEKQHGMIPPGSVVFIRSDWSKRWTQPGLAAETAFPGVKLDALKFLHLERKILFHGHEPLDTDTTPTLEGEAWLLQNGYTQAEGVANLDKAPETGALVEIGYPKFGGGTGGYARFVAICPPDWPHGTKIDPAKESPLPKMPRPLIWNDAAGMRTR